jgi:thiamine biosynthesis lipoprotein
MTTSRARKSSDPVSRLRVALGTFIGIEAHAADADIARAGIDAAFEATLTVQQLMHPTRGTDLAALAGCIPGTALELHPWTWEVFDLCARLHHVSQGVFDPCLGSAPGRFADLELLPGYRIRTRATVHVDLGGIAKGYAVDRALDALQAAGCTGGLVNAGGDLAAFGPQAYPIVCGTTPGALLVHLRDRALASSDATPSPARPTEHRGYYHGVDRARAVSGQVTVLAASAAIADGLTKCLLCGTADSHGRLLRAFGAERLAQNASPNPRSKRVKLLLRSNH